MGEREDDAARGQPRRASDSGAAASRLQRRLGTFDAVVIGLGSMIGAGVFAAFAPAARLAGNAMLLGLGIAAFVAYCNATSSAQLAALYPQAGGTYVYGRRRLSPFWGALAGWAFVIGKLASCAAMAMTFAHYVAPAYARPIAIAAVVAVTAVNYVGVQKTALATRLILALVLSSLVVAVAAALSPGDLDAGRLWPLASVSPRDVLGAAGVLFFAFAGYARIATLGEEVREPARTIPRAIVVALAIVFVVYAVIAVALLLAVDPPALAGTDAPLAVAAARGGRWPVAVVRVGAAVASLGSLLSLVVGVSRTAFAMAAEGDLPRALAAVHPRYRVPHRAELCVGAIVALAAGLADVRSAIGFSSFAVLAYYAVANAAAYTLTPAERRWPRWLTVAGLIGCAAIGVALPIVSTLAGAGLLALGAVVYGVRHRRRP